MKFPRNTQFDSHFEKVTEAQWFPYIGEDFGKDGERIMVYAHNIPIKPEEYEEKSKWWTNKATWANAMEEFTYERKDYTKTFRQFVKAATGLKANYGRDSAPEILNRVDSFVRKIAYLNFIQGLVISDKPLTVATVDQIEASKRINKEFLKIMGITRCICWGKPVYQYVKSLEGYAVISEQPEGKKGFSSCNIDTGDTLMNCLRIYHPSMPSLGVYSDETHAIISEFCKH